MTYETDAILEVDPVRGVVYVHLKHSEDIKAFGGQTVIRLQNIETAGKLPHAMVDMRNPEITPMDRMRSALPGGSSLQPTVEKTLTSLKERGIKPTMDSKDLMKLMRGSDEFVLRKD